jgi:hypothetical protein
MITKPLSIAVLTLIALLHVAPVWALDFKATLTSARLYGRPGQILTHQFQLTLPEGQKRTQFRAHVEDFWRSEDGKQSFYAKPGTLQRSCAEWTVLNPVEATVEPGNTLTIRVSVAVSTDAEPGGYWCVLTVDEVNDPLESTEGVDIKFLASISTGIFVYIDPLRRAAEIADVEVSPQQALIKIRNTGNTPVSVEGRFEFIRVGETTPIAIARLARGTLLTEPINTARFAADLPPESELPSGRYLVRAVIDIGLDHYIGVQRQLDVQRPFALRH